MNKSITSKEAILQVSKSQVAEYGLQSLNIRDIAKKSNISIGSVYNYFPTKGDLVAATVEAIWFEIMQGLTLSEAQHDFSKFISTLYNHIQKGSKDFPDFFNSHSMSIMQSDKSKGKEKMDQYFLHMKGVLKSVLSTDERIRPNVFTEAFTKEEFIDFILSNMISLLIKKANSCDFLLEVISKIIY